MVNRKQWKNLKTLNKKEEEILDSAIFNNKRTEQGTCKHNKVHIMLCFRKGSLDEHNAEMAKIVVMYPGYSVLFLLQLKEKIYRRLTCCWTY